MTTYLKSNSIIACIKLDANFKDENKNSSTSRISVREKQKKQKKQLGCNQPTTTALRTFIETLSK